MFQELFHMNMILLHIFREELLAEAKRLVPICYEEKDLFKCSSEKIRKKINKKYKEFEIHIHLMMISLCNLKAEKKDYKKYQIDYEDLAEHHINYIKWKFKINRCDLNDVTELIATDIIKNKYKNESLFTLIPKLSKKHMKCHNDSVDCECVVMLLEEKLNNKGYNLLSSNFFDLKKLA